MSRAKATDVSSPISLFPFIGVLLSTMGALLVVLIAVSRSAHDAAVREAEAKKTAAAAEGQDDARQKLQQANDYINRLNRVREEAEQRLRDDQLRLSHIEDHTRRLKEQWQALQGSVNELVALEGEHYDDRKQAEREIERLNLLIASTQEAVDAARDENRGKKRSYAIIPYEGPHGTRRRPIYIECRKNEVVLQPEDIHLTPEDFRPPLGAGNPLAAALRAAREYIVREDPAAGTSREAQPYPLILVRPEGILAYYRVRQAIESWDSDFGYELIDNDWKLEFPAANPLLAELQQQAVAQSRTRQQMLVAAAPRAYGSRHVGGGEFVDDDELTDEDEDVDAGAADRGSGYGAGGSRLGGGGGSSSGEGGPYAANGGAYGGGTSSAGGGGGSGGPATTGTPGGGAGSPGGNAVPAMTGAQQGRSLNVSAGTAADDHTGSPGAPPPLPPSATGSSLAGGVGEANLPAADRSVGNGLSVRAPSTGARTSNDEPAERMPVDMQLNRQQKFPAQDRGENWAIKPKRPTSTPVKRMIRVAVHADRLEILPEAQPTSPRKSGSREIPLDGSTAAKLDEFVRAVQQRVYDWDLAGADMYWRPVLVLEVAPDAQARAQDLERLLKNSGIEVENQSTAARPAEGTPRATR